LDIVGNQVDDSGISLDPNGVEIDRKKYITNRYGHVVADVQRDQIYTGILAKKISASYHRDNIALSTHLAAYAGWQLLCDKHPRLDDVQKASLGPDERRILRIDLLKAIDKIHNQVLRARENGKICAALPGNASDILQDALKRFGSYHRSRCLAVRGNYIEIGSKLALYYGNRLTDYGFKVLEN
jgi:hypothetical protein